MAYSQVTFTGDGVTTDFNVSFPYLLTSHVSVLVDDVEATVTWPSSGVVRVSPAPANGAVVFISRDSNRSARLTDYEDAQSLTEAVLDFDARQCFYVAQEAFDALSISSDGGGDMLRANNLSDVMSASAARTNIGAVAKAGDTMTGLLTLSAGPSAPLHAATKAYVDAIVAAPPASGVTSYNGRTGVVTALSADVTGALGFTPVNKAGDTMLGLLTLSGAPTVALHAATKAYVDAVAGLDLLPLNNTWTGTTNDFGTASASDFMRFDTFHGHLWIKQTNQPTGARGENIAIAADTYHTSGSAQLANASFHVYSGGTHSGNAWGVVTEAWNESTKIGGTTQLFGAEFSIINQIHTSAATRHAGVLVVFKNRLDTAHTPTANGTVPHAIPSTGEAYNKNTHALLIDCGGGRNRNHLGSGGNVGIECGWNRGITFGYDSLDTTDQGATKAIGIDFTALDAATPEGGSTPRYYDRTSALIALPDNGKITLSTNLSDSILKFDSATGRSGFFQGTSIRAGVNMTNGKFFASGGIELTGALSLTPLDLSGLTTSALAIDMAAGALMKFRSGTGYSGSITWYSGAFVPTYVGALGIKVDASSLYIPVCNNHA